MTDEGDRIYIPKCTEKLAKNAKIGWGDGDRQGDRDQIEQPGSYVE